MSERELDQGQHERLCAYVFGELVGAERAAFERELAASPELRAEQARLEATVALVQTVRTEERLSPETKTDLVASARRSRFRVLGRRPVELLAAAVVLVLGAAAALRHFAGARSLDLLDVRDGGAVARAPELEPRLKERRVELEDAAAGKPAASSAEGALEAAEGRVAGGEAAAAELRDALGDFDVETASGASLAGLDALTLEAKEEDESLLRLGMVVQRIEPTGPGGSPEAEARFHGLLPVAPGSPSAGPSSPGPNSPGPSGLASRPPRAGGGVPPARAVPLAAKAEETGSEGWFLGQGEKKQEAGEAPRKSETLSFNDEEAREERGLLLALGYGGDDESSAVEAPQRVEDWLAQLRVRSEESPRDMFFRWFGDAPFVSTSEERVSTFAADVDTASYALTRAYLKRGELPPREAVRTEEFVNYFRADQPAPGDGAPFALGLELAPNPFGSEARSELLRVTVRARDVADFERKPVALTLVVDNSGSMQEGGRLELVKRALSLLLRELGPGDSVALVKFSEHAALVSSALPATRRGELEGLIGALPIEGGTNVEAGLVLGYEQALAALVPGAVNRVVLCSDGVGNIGETTAKALLARVEEARAKGVYLNTVGVGMGNHNDAFLEELADKGDGVCHYVDDDAEAKRVFVDGLASAFQPVARDVKLQVEFDPAQVERWRLLGYENRALRTEDFRNDAVDAGEVNAGHQVTALYELVRNPGTGPVATARVRYKPPFALDAGQADGRAAAENEVARELERKLSGSEVLSGFAAGSPGFRRAVLAAQFAEVLRASEHARGDSFARLVQEAQALTKVLADADLGEFVELLGLANPLLDARAKAETPRVVELSDRLARLQYEQALALRQRELAAEAGEAPRAQTEEDEALRRRAAEIERLEAELRGELVQLFAAGG